MPAVLQREPSTFADVPRLFPQFGKSLRNLARPAWDVFKLNDCTASSKGDCGCSGNCEVNYGLNSPAELRGGVSPGDDVWHLSQYVPALGNEYYEGRHAVEYLASSERDLLFLFDGIANGAPKHATNGDSGACCEGCAQARFAGPPHACAIERLWAMAASLRDLLVKYRSVLGSSIVYPASLSHSVNSVASKMAALLPLLGQRVHRATAVLSMRILGMNSEIRSAAEFMIATLGSFDVLSGDVDASIWPSYDGALQEVPWKKGYLRFALNTNPEECQAKIKEDGRRIRKLRPSPRLHSHRVMYRWVNGSVQARSQDIDNSTITCVGQCPDIDPGFDHFGSGYCDMTAIGKNLFCHCRRPFMDPIPDPGKVLVPALIVVIAAVTAAAGWGTPVLVLPVPV